MSMVSDALKKAQAQAALQSKGMRVDLTGASGDPSPRAITPVLAALAVAVTVGVATILVVAYLLRANDPPGREARFAEAGAAAEPSPSDASPILSVQPYQDMATGTGPAESNDPPPSHQPMPEHKSIANLPQPDAPSESTFRAALDPAQLNLPTATAPGPPDSAPEPKPPPEPERPRPPLEEDGEYVQVLDVADLPKLELTGIAWSDFAKIALVNGMSLEPGDLIHGIRVKAVEPQRVHFRAPDGRTFYLRMR